MHEAADALSVDRARVAVLIDGQSGAGKTTLAALLRDGWRGAVEVVALDDVYPGWDGLAAALMLRASRSSNRGRWGSRALEPVGLACSVPGDEMLTRADASLIIEGSGC